MSDKINLKQKQLIGIVSLIVILSGAVVVTNMDDSYYCPSRDMVLECSRLSSSGITCYSELGGRRCSEGWRPLNEYLTDEAEYFNIEANGCTFKCLVPENGVVDSYDVCECEKGERVEQAYLFEITGSGN